MEAFFSAEADSDLCQPAVRLASRGTNCVPHIMFHIEGSKHGINTSEAILKYENIVQELSNFQAVQIWGQL